MFEVKHEKNSIRPSEGYTCASILACKRAVSRTLERDCGCLGAQLNPIIVNNVWDYQFDSGRSGTLPTAAMGPLFNLALESLSHLFLSHAAIHPLGFVLAVVAGDMECSAGITHRVFLVAFFAPESTSPTTIRAPYCAVMARTMRQVHIAIHTTRIMIDFLFKAVRVLVKF
jgi:hypothetical protein